MKRTSDAAINKDIVQILDEDKQASISDDDIRGAIEQLAEWDPERYSTGPGYPRKAVIYTWMGSHRYHFAS
jgi:hypothetical protein